jgi:chitosanase
MNARFVASVSSLALAVACSVACSPAAPSTSAADSVPSPQRAADPAASQLPANGASSASGGTGAGASPSDPGAPAPAAGVNRLDAAQRLRADRLVSVFENNTIDIDYAYVEALGDGRGYTVGRGFTTATGDAYSVVAEYVQATPNDALARFLPELKRLADDGDGSINGLKGFPAAWQSAAAGAGLKASEDHEVDRSSYLPATVHVDALGATTALTLTVLYDTVFMHGDDADPDGTPALIAAATAKAGGTPKTGISEHVWLSAFLDVRRADLANANDPETRVVWAEAVSRVDALRGILTANNDALSGPITVGYDYGITVP